MTRENSQTYQSFNIQPRHKKNERSGLSVRPANGMSSVLNIQSVFFFSIHPRGKTNMLPYLPVELVTIFKLGFFATEWEGGWGGGGGGTRLGGPKKNL